MGWPEWEGERGEGVREGMVKTEGGRGRRGSGWVVGGNAPGGPSASGQREADPRGFHKNTASSTGGPICR